MGGFGRFRCSPIDYVPAPCCSQKEKGGDGGGDLGERQARLGPVCLSLRPRRLADFERVDVDGLDNVLELSLAEIVDLEVEPSLDLPIGVLAQIAPGAATPSSRAATLTPSPTAS
jgi:hypothetical protein